MMAVDTSRTTAEARTPPTPMSVDTVHLYAVTTAPGGALLDLELISAGVLSIGKTAADGVCQLRVGETALALTAGTTVASTAGPYEQSTQWTLLPQSNEQAFALLFLSPDEERHARSALVCGWQIQFDLADEVDSAEEASSAAPAKGGRKSGSDVMRAMREGRPGDVMGGMVDLALDDGRTAKRIEAGGQAAARGILGASKMMGAAIHSAGQAAQQRMSQSSTEYHATGVVRQKIVFKTRPVPVIVKAAAPAGSSLCGTKRTRAEPEPEAVLAQFGMVEEEAAPAGRRISLHALEMRNAAIAQTRELLNHNKLGGLSSRRIRTPSSEKSHRRASAPTSAVSEEEAEEGVVRRNSTEATFHRSAGATLMR